jgi:hypothetical protein
MHNETAVSAIPARLNQVHRAHLWVLMSSIVVFHFVVGFGVVNPRNTRWLLGGDAASNYLGWEFFRKAPLASFPLGSNPNFGTGFSSSIVFTDSIPLLAIPLKFILFAYHSDFQYFGFWLLACFVLQGFFAVKLITRYVESIVIVLSGSALFLIAPVFVYRLTFDGFGHLALTGQFICLAAMGLVLDQTSRLRNWHLLLPIAVLIHFYLFGIAFVFFVTNFLIRFFIEKSTLTSRLRLISTSLSSFGLVVFCFYLAGGFASKSATAASYGRYRSSLSSLFDSKPSLDTGWSKILTDIPDLPGSSEGFSFLGVAALLLFPIAIFGLYSVAKRRDYGFILVLSIALLLLLFSFSPSISIADRELFNYSVPQPLNPIFSAFRSAGRFSWTFVYVTLLLVVIGVQQLKRRSNFFVLLLPISLVLQAWDSGSALANTHERFRENSFQTVLLDPMWIELGGKYQNLVTVPPLNNDPNWIDFALLAKRFNMTTNAAYVGRADEAFFSVLSDRLQKQIENYDFFPDTLYILTDYPPNPLSSVLLALNKSSEIKGASVYSLDDFVVVAP